MMESIGLFDAKTHLSELVARAERGEEVVITRHNKPVAKLVPVGRARRAAASARLAAIDAMLAFEPIEIGDTPVEDLVRAGRE
jgi:prevent-host-death family protein